MSVTVNAVNDAPEPEGDEVTTYEGQAIVTGDVLANDHDLDSETLEVESYTQPENGWLVYNEDGTFTYVPNPDFSGEDGFTYTVSDGDGGTSTATVNITVNPLNEVETEEDSGEDEESEDEGEGTENTREGTSEESGSGEDVEDDLDALKVLDPLEGLTEDPTFETSQFGDADVPAMETGMISRSGYTPMEEEYDFSHEVDFQETLTGEKPEPEPTPAREGITFEDMFQEIRSSEADEPEVERSYDLEQGPDRMELEDRGPEEELDADRGDDENAGFLARLWALFRIGGKSGKNAADDEKDDDVPRRR